VFILGAKYEIIMKLRIIAFLLLLPVIVVMTSCKKNHYKVNTRSISVNIKIERLEKDLFSLDPGQVIPALPALKKKYGGFLQLFSLVINTGDVNEESFGDFLLRFCSDKQNNEVYSLTMKKFPDLRLVEAGLEDAFRHYLYYFPERKVPSVYSCITGFNNSIITGDSILGIGLDRYLGADCEFYPRLNIYKYLAARMTPENIVPDCIYGWAASEWDFSVLKYPADNVLAGIIHDGKLKYFEKCMLPETSDELLFGFTPDQMKFCRNNESQMWQYLIENNLLFSSDQFEIRKLTGEAPFTGYFSKESPGRAAVWLGFRIVESYMMRNPEMKIQDLINKTDVQEILEKAKYSPQ
jgi:hypothetical protein